MNKKEQLTEACNLLIDYVLESNVPDQKSLQVLNSLRNQIEDYE